MTTIKKTGLFFGCIAAGAASFDASAFTAFGVTDTNNLVSFDTDNPNDLFSGRAIRGLESNEDILGIDFRPTTGLLYGLGSFGNVYTFGSPLSPNSTATLQFNLDDDTDGNADFAADGGLNGTSFGFDFNPAADFAGANSLRIVSNQDQNLAVNVDSGAVLVANDVFYPGGTPNPNIVGEAYNNSILGGNPNGINTPGQAAGNGTTQYAIDSGTDGLVLQAFNAGVLTMVGSLGENTTANVGFDILSPTIGQNFAFATLDSAGSNTSNLFSINLASGEATNLGEIGGGLLVPNLALVPVVIPEPGTIGLLAVGSLLVFKRRRTA